MTVDELLEACGPGLILFRHPSPNRWDGKSGVRWCAALSEERDYLCADEYFIDEGSFRSAAEGSTAREALEKLLEKLILQR